MKILNLFRPSQREKELEAELSGSTRKPSATPTPPRRGPAIPGSMTPTHTEAGAGELAELRSSLQAMDQRLLVLTHERDSIRDEFSQYRQAASSDLRDLERENARLRESLNENAMMLSKMIANGGADGPIPEANGEPERKGLARAIEANKAHQAQTTNQFQRIPRPTL